jgi:hypothetical protein
MGLRGFSNAEIITVTLIVNHAELSMGHSEVNIRKYIEDDKA